MKTRLLGAAVLIALAVIFVPMFFSGSPPAPGGDQSVSLAIPPAPDRDLQTKTMSLDPSAAASAPVGAATTAGAVASGDRIATVTIDSNRPRDVELDPEAGRKPAPITVTTGSGTSPAQPVIPQRQAGTAAPTPAAATKPAPPSAPAQPVAKPAAPAPAPAAASVGHGSYTINLSAYASASGAAKLQSRVRALGYPVSGHAITRAGQSRTQVVAGPFETRTTAEAARLKITQAIPGVPAKLEQDAEVSGTPTAAAPTAAATHTAKAGGWAVQLAAVSSQADANALRDKLRAAGFDGFVDSVQSGGRTLWRVRAGPQTQRADALRVHDQIKAKLGIDGNVVSVP
ncbi:SPOR domain-containing protein [Rhodanobacter lindaniclasticus]